MATLPGVFDILRLLPGKVSAGLRSQIVDLFVRFVGRRAMHDESAHRSMDSDANRVNDRPQAIPIRLADAVTTIVPDGARLLGGHRDAGSDALMHWRLFRDLGLRVKA